MAIPQRKRGNSDYASSSFYLPKQLNIDVEIARLKLKKEGFTFDRSDLISALLYEWLKNPRPMPRIGS